VALSDSLPSQFSIIASGNLASGFWLLRANWPKSYPRFHTIALSIVRLCGDILVTCACRFTRGGGGGAFPTDVLMESVWFGVVKTEMQARRLTAWNNISSRRRPG